jgi:type IV fimbrial biogenesis protein FimT
MSIVLVIAIPSQKNLLTQSKSDVIRLQLVRAINLTRHEAILRGEKVTLCSSANQTTCSGRWKEGYLIVSHEKVIYTFLNPANTGELYWRAFPNHQTQLDYLPSGELASENGTFWYCLPVAKNPSWAIVLSQSGRAREVVPNQKREWVGSKMDCAS